MSYRQRATREICQGLLTAKWHIAQFRRLFLYLFRQHEAQDTLRAVQYGVVRRRFELYPWTKPDNNISPTQIAP